MLKTERKLRD
jgi:hypothetical protein